MKRSKFSLSNYKLTTMDMGDLVPIGWYEALPGDSIQQSTSALIRATPLLSPVMHPVRIRIHHWFVPNRLIWDDWEDFITGGPDGNSTPVYPHGSHDQISSGFLADYMGLPVGTYVTPLLASVLPFRAYKLIFNEHYRDQDLVPEVEFSRASGLDLDNNPMQKVAWEKDYFTTARPWETKGNEISIPISGEGPVSGIGKFNDVFQHVDQSSRETGGIIRTYANASNNADVENYRYNYEEDPNNPGFPNIRASFEGANITVNDLRLSLALQRYQEARAQYGSRYVEYLRYLGIKSSDARLQLPEYLGGGRQVIQFSEVLQTAADDIGAEQTPVGTLRGHGIAAMRTNKFRRFFEEHGIVMTLMSVVPKTMYMQSLNRAFSRETKEDYFQKELQFIGEQSIPNKEIYAEHSSPNGIFGYQSRYDEYRYQPSTISGEFNDINNHWHYARDFEDDIALNQSFIEATPTKRVNAEQTTNVLYVMANHSIQARRAMSKFAKPRTF